MKSNKKAFTLTEILVGLTVIGAIAAILVPSIMSDMQKKLLATQAKSNITEVQQLISDTMAELKNNTLEDTTLTVDRFNTSKSCNSTNLSNCWKVSYKNLNGNTVTVPNTDVTAAILKNSGTILLSAYTSGEGETNTAGEQCIKEVWYDVNGEDTPNKLGRDLFVFYLTSKGRISDIDKCNPPATPTSKENLIKGCKGVDTFNPSYCLTALQLNNWVMDY